MKGISEEFWKNIERNGPDECWWWLPTKGNNKYGQTLFLKRRTGVHRIAWALHNKRWPSPEKFVCHSCDNPACCNPAHLWLGDFRSNQQDCVAKSRHSAKQQRKLTPEQVHLIRTCPIAKPFKELAKEFGVDYNAIWLAYHNKSYQDLPFTANHVRRNYKFRSRKLTEEQVRQIRSRPPTRSLSSYAREFGVNDTIVKHAYHRRTYRDLP